MWFIVMLFMAIFSTLAWYISDKSQEYKLSLLSLISWGTVIMVFADHLMGYIEDGEFLEISADALILGFVLAAVALLIWLVSLIVSDPKGKWRTKAQLS